MPSYFEHMAGKGGCPEVALDVIEFDQPQPAGIEVSEKHFDSIGEFLAFIARETGRGP
jgi:hypothetical protein